MLPCGYRVNREVVVGVLHGLKFTGNDVKTEDLNSGATSVLGNENRADTVFGILTREEANQEAIENGYIDKRRSQPIAPTPWSECWPSFLRPSILNPPARGLFSLSVILGTSAAGNCMTATTRLFYNVWRFMGLDPAYQQGGAEPSSTRVGSFAATCQWPWAPPNIWNIWQIYIYIYDGPTTSVSQMCFLLLLNAFGRRWFFRYM